MSLMLRHQKAAEANGGEAAEPEKTATTVAIIGGPIGKQQLFELLDTSLETDLKSLKDITSVERKVELKRTELVPKYRPYVEQLKEAGLVHPLLGQMVVWLFDVGEIKDCIELGFYCLDNDIVLPERFNRKGGMRTFLADSVLEWAEKTYAAGHSINPYFESLFSHVSRLGDDPWDVPDQLAAKYHKLDSFVQEDAGRLDLAVDTLEKAQALGASVKTRLEALWKKLAAMPAPAPFEGADGEALGADKDAGKDTGKDA